MSPQLRWVLGLGLDNTLRGHELGCLPLACAERHFHGLHEGLADVPHHLPARRLGLGIEARMRRTRPRTMRT